MKFYNINDKKPEHNQIVVIKHTTIEYNKLVTYYAIAKFNQYHGFEPCTELLNINVHDDSGLFVEFRPDIEFWAEIEEE